MPVLVVQKGHCYRTTGATGTNGEQTFVTAAANACAALLHGRGGWTVRVILADEGSTAYRGDAFVALHCDGSLNTGVRGASVGYRTPEGQATAQAWKRAYQNRGWDGGFRVDNYTTALAQYYGTGTAVNVGTRRAFIVECGFLTNPEDRATLTGPGGAARVALAIGDALGIPTDAQQGAEALMTPNDIWMFPCVGVDPVTGARETWAAVQWLTRADFRTLHILAKTDLLLAAQAGDLTPERAEQIIDESVQRHTPTADQVAAALLPGLSEHLGTLDDAQLAELSRVVNDEHDRRARERANTEV